MARFFDRPELDRLSGFAAREKKLLAADDEVRRADRVKPRCAPRASPARAWITTALVALCAGCGGGPQPSSPAVDDARASLEYEQSVRNGLERELAKLAGEHQVHVWRAALIAGDLRPPAPFRNSKSPLIRSLPSWGIGRLWRLWATHPEDMPWYDNAVGLLTRRNADAKFRSDTRSIEKQLEDQKKRVIEAKKYLELVQSAAE
jgi:hypothetical protein